MAISTEETSALNKAEEWASALLGVYSGYRISEQEAEAAKYQYQLEALRQQQAAPAYDAQALDWFSNSQPVSASLAPNVGAGWLTIGLVGLVVYLYASGGK